MRMPSLHVLANRRPRAARRAGFGPIHCPPRGRHVLLNFPRPPWTFPRSLWRIVCSLVGRGVLARDQRGRICRREDLYDRSIPNWRTDGYSLRYAANLAADDLRRAHDVAKQRLVHEINARTNAGFDRDVLTLGFARRATACKRPMLVLHDPDRLRAIASKQGGLQIALAGKAHPADTQGKALVQALHQAVERVTGRAPRVPAELRPRDRAAPHGRCGRLAQHPATEFHARRDITAGFQNISSVRRYGTTVLLVKRFLAAFPATSKRSDLTLPCLPVMTTPLASLLRSLDGRPLVCKEGQASLPPPRGDVPRVRSAL